MVAFNLLLKELDYIVFYLYDTNINFSTTTMTFISGNNIIINKNHMRIKRIKDCKDTSYFYNAIDYALVPEDFNIEIDYEDNPFANIFNRIAMLLSLAYISSNLSIEGDSFKGQIIGQRNFEFNYNLSSVNENNEFYNKFNPRTEQFGITLNRDKCNQCPYKDQWKPTFNKNKTALVISWKSTERAKQQRYMKSEEFKEHVRFRNGVESLPSIIRRKYHVDKIL